MSDAVIVATGRSPIGRAFKGSLVDLRPDDLAAQVIAATVEKIGLFPQEIDDVIVGCGLPGGEQGFNLARVINLLLTRDYGSSIPRQPIDDAPLWSL